MTSSGIGRPSAFLYLSDRLAGPAFDAIASAGFDRSDVPEGTSIAIVEIGQPEYLRVLDQVLDAGIRTVVIGEDPDDFVTVGLRAAGVWRVVRAEAFLADPGAVVPLIA